jgi:hypothetical protein
VILTYTNASNYEQLVITSSVAVACPFEASFVDYQFLTDAPGAVDGSVNNATVTLLNYPQPGLRRMVKGINFQNAGTVSTTVSITLSKTVAGVTTTYDLISSLILGAGSTLTYNDRTGWRVITQMGGSLNLRAGWVQTFMVNSTWYKPAGCKFFMVDVVGGGGAGGAGGAGNSLYIGGGGGGGCRVRRLFLASDLPASVAISVAAQTASASGVLNSAGNNGAAGGSSSFGSYLISYGGGGGCGGNNNGSGGASAGGGGGGATSVGVSGTSSSMTSGGAAMLTSAVLSGGLPTAQGGAGMNGSQGGTTSFLGGGGGGGGGRNGGNSYFSAGGGGGNTTYPPGTVGQGQFPASTLSGANGFSVLGFMGTGGAYGYNISTTGDCTGGKGGDGGWPGGGGGGGGSAVSSGGNATGGAGGKGGAGMVRVMGW